MSGVNGVDDESLPRSMRARLLVREEGKTEREMIGNKHWIVWSPMLSREGPEKGMLSSSHRTRGKVKSQKSSLQKLKGQKS